MRLKKEIVFQRYLLLFFFNISFFFQIKNRRFLLFLFVFNFFFSVTIRSFDVNCEPIRVSSMRFAYLRRYNEKRMELDFEIKFSILELSIYFLSFFLFFPDFFLAFLFFFFASSSPQKLVGSVGTENASIFSFWGLVQVVSQCLKTKSMKI